MSKFYTSLFLLALVASASAGCPFSFLHTSEETQEIPQDFLTKGKDKIVVPPVTNSAKQTNDAFFQEMLNTEYSSLPSWDGKGITVPKNLIKFGFEKMSVTVDRTEDYMPKGRTKWIHTLGTVAQVKWVATDAGKKYDGLFKGADHGLARMSLAANPDKIGFTPGMAVKFFRNNARVSGNIISMFSLEGQQDNVNFFANKFSNAVPEPTSATQKFLAFVTFRRASKCPTVLALGDFAQYDQDGNYVSNPKYPKQIFFTPVSQTQFSATNSNGRDFRKDMSTLPAGTTLYQIETIENGQNVVLGKLVTTSKFVSSDFGDNVLFFKHQKGEVIDCTP